MYRLKSSREEKHEVWFVGSIVSEEIVSTLNMEVAGYCGMLVPVTKAHSAISQKTKCHLMLGTGI